MSRQPPHLFYDGPCRLCQRCVQWLQAHAPEVHCSPLQGKHARQMLDASLTTPPLQGVVLVDDMGITHVGPKAVRAMSHYLSRPLRWVFRWTPAWGYWLVAQTRSWWGRDDSCTFD